MKTTRKPTPVSLYDMAGLERWLEELADRGLSPVRIGNYFTKFHPGGVPGTRFRLEAAGTDEEPPQDMLDAYRASGWEYLGRVTRLYYIFAAQAPEAPELHTDPVTRGWSLDHLARQTRRSFLLLLAAPFLLVLLIALAAFWFQWSFRQDFPWLEFPDMALRLPLVLVQSSPLLVFIPFLLWSWLWLLGQLLQLLRLRKELAQGFDSDRTERPKKRSWKWMNLIYLVLSVLLSLSLVLTNLSRLAYTSLARTSLPYVSLEELEGEPLLLRRAPDANRVQRQFSLLAPLYYTAEQRSYRPGVDADPNWFSSDPADADCTYSPQLDMTRFRLLFPAMARPVAQAQMDSDRLLNLNWTYEEADWPGTDFVLLAKAEGFPWQLAALGRGCQVAVFRYAGKEDLGDHLDLLAAMVCG